MFGILYNTVEGLVEASINTVKAPIGVFLAPLDDGKTIEESVEGIQKGISKIGKSDDN